MLRPFFSRVFYIHISFKLSRKGKTSLYTITKQQELKTNKINNNCLIEDLRTSVELEMLLILVV